jgi:hypothetical protein
MPAISSIAGYFSKNRKGRQQTDSYILLDFPDEWNGIPAQLRHFCPTRRSRSQPHSPNKPEIPPVRRKRQLGPANELVSRFAEGVGSRFRTTTDRVVFRSAKVRAFAERKTTFVPKAPTWNTLSPKTTPDPVADFPSNQIRQFFFCRS